jgi:cytoskeletal protein RodZ
MGFPMPSGPGLGTCLRDARERLGIDLDALAAKTRIPVRTLRLLEAEAWDMLPAEVFVRGFARSCALALGLDAAEIVERLTARLAEHRRLPAPPPVRVGELAANAGGPRRARVALFVLLVIVIATITLSLLPGRARPPGPGVSANEPARLVGA